MARVFLSCVESDNAIAGQLAKLLEEAGHHVLWRVESDPTLAARDNAEVILVLWSATSVESPTLYEDASVGISRNCLCQVAIDKQVRTAIPGRFRGLDAFLFDEYKAYINTHQKEYHFLRDLDGPLFSLSGSGKTEDEEEEEEEEAKDELRQAILRRQRKKAAISIFEIEAGKLVHKIPATMRTGISETVEVRIGKGNTRRLSAGLLGGGEIVTEDISIVETMTVELASSGGLKIERRSRRTQLVKGPVLRAAASEQKQFGRWVWHVTPKKVGTHELFVKVSADLNDSRGVATSITLPDRLFAVKVKVNYAEMSFSLAKWAATGVSSLLIAGFVGSYTQEVWWPTLRGWLAILGLV
jgi:hypothetical protein